MIANDSFDFFCVTPCGLWDPGIAIAAARAGAIGILDLTYASEAAGVPEPVERLSRLAQ